MNLNYQKINLLNRKWIREISASYILRLVQKYVYTMRLSSNCLKNLETSYVFSILFCLCNMIYQNLSLLQFWTREFFIGGDYFSTLQRKLVQHAPQLNIQAGVPASKCINFMQHETYSNLPTKWNAYGKNLGLPTLSGYFWPKNPHKTRRCAPV